jgi:hypothetical protein
MTEVTTQIFGTRARVAMWACLAALVLGLCVAAPASSAVSIQSFNTNSTNTEAGNHPDLSATFVLEDPGEPESAESVAVNIPRGVFGNPNAIVPCQQAYFALMECTQSSQAGYITIRARHEGDPNFLLGTAPVYVVSPRPDKEPARLAFYTPIVNIGINIPIHLRTADDYGLRMTVDGIPQSVPVASASLIVWGVPAALENDNYRFRKGSPGNPAGCPGEASALCASQGGNAPNPAGILPKPLVNNPSDCTGEPLVSVLEVRSYQDPGTVSKATATYPETTDCEKQNFKPVLNMALTTDETDSPSGMDMILKGAQFLGVAAMPSPIKAATVELPVGLSVNPDAADGQTACADAQARFDSEGPAQCPDTSKIGTFEIESPALDTPLGGAMYIGEPKPGNQYRLFMIASGYGINAKMVADVQPDPVTGQVKFVVDDLPQVPFETFRVHLFASDRGLLATPTHCTIYNVESSFEPWNDRLSPQPSRPVFSLGSGPIGRPCPNVIRPFSPRLVAGMSNPSAGGFSSFHLKLDRDDGDQYLADLGFKMPPGFTGYLRGIGYCPETSIASAAQRLGRSEQAQPSCPPSSFVGSTNVAAGPGGHPFNAVGRMYLAGPFKGGSLSLVAVTPALAGPYDYGTVVVRVALHVDPRTAQVTAVSDRVPHIIGGIPIRMRSIQVNIDRPNFTINPTSCRNFLIDSQGIGDQGTLSPFSSPFHAVNCASLDFKPRMTIRQLGKRGQTRRSKNPRLRFDLFTRNGDANLKSLAVTLPKAFAIDQRHLGNICSKAQLEAELCKGRQPIGNAWVKSPLLDERLSGPAYAVSGFGKLPRVAFILDGQVRLVPQAESKSVRNGHLRTTVPVIPDAPVGHFRLNLLGGNKGYLVNTRSLCSFPPVATLEFSGQNGRRHTERVRVKTPCGKQKRKAKRSVHRGP